FGLTRSSVSRRFIRASAGELRRLLERRHDDADWLALILDGKTFAGDQLVIALGVTATGEKRVLGLVQTASENRRVIASFLRELRLLNASAAASLEEGLEETLTLHRLGVFPALGVSFKTTNLIESVMSRLEARTARVTRWRTSDQKLRWCAAALWAMERRFRRVKGCTHLPLLKQALRTQ